MGNSDAYSIVKALIEKNLLVIQCQGLVEWLDRLRSKEEIWEEEIEDLLQLADHLQIYTSPGSEFVSSEKLPCLGGLQDPASLQKFLQQRIPDASPRDREGLKNFIDKYIGYWAVHSTILGIGLSLTI